MAASNEVYIPPSSVRVRIFSPKTGLYWTANSDLLALTTNPGGLESWFTIENVADDSSKRYFRNVQTGRYFDMEAISKPASRASMYSDTSFSSCKITPRGGVGENRGRFQMYSPYRKTYFGIQQAPMIGTTMREVSDPDDGEWFQWVFKDMNLISINYKLDDAKILQDQPYTLTDESFDNPNPNAKVTETFTVSETVEESRRWDLEFGFKIGTEIGGSAGIPEVGEGSFKVTVEANLRTQFGVTSMKSKTISKSRIIEIPPMTKIRVKASATKSNIEVPYVAVFSSGTDSANFEVKGYYSGVAVHSTKLQIINL